MAAVERARLARLIGEWLEVDLGRGPFIIVDCEADGPCPGPGNLTEMGAVFHVRPGCNA